MAKINRTIKDTPFKKNLEQQKISSSDRMRLNKQYKGAKFMSTGSKKVK